MSLPLNKHLMTDGSSSPSAKKAKYQNTEDPLESAVANPPSMSSSIIHGDLSSRNTDGGDLSSRNTDGEDPGYLVFTPIIPDQPIPDPKFYLDDAWEKLKPTIKAIFLDEPRHFHYSELFNAIEMAWWTKSGESLYKLMLDECGIYIFEAIQSLESHCDASDFLPRMEKCLVDFRAKLRHLSDIAGGQEIGLKTFWDLDNELFIKYLCLPHKVRDKLISIILDLTRDHRSGKSVDMTHFQNLMNMFYGPAFYESRFFEKPFVACATEFYSAEAIQFHEQSDIHEYLKHVQLMLHQEKINCRHLYFFRAFEDSLIEAFERILVKDHASAIIEKGFVMFMDERRHDDLRRLYRLFSQMDLLGLLNGAFNDYIRQTGEKILQESSSLLEFKKCIDKVCLSCFREDASFEKTAKQCLKDLGLPFNEPEKKSLHPHKIQRRFW